MCYNFARRLRKFGSIHSRNAGSKLVWDDVAHSCSCIDLARLKAKLASISIVYSKKI